MDRVVLDCVLFIRRFFRSSWNNLGLDLDVNADTLTNAHTADCDADAIRSAYNITGENVSREEAY
jgi:hypothetical protein